MTGTGELWAWTATEVVAATTSGEVSAREVTEAVLSRIDALNPRLNAITLELHDDARRRAGELDDRYARGEPCGALHGVAVTIKDNIDVQGQRTPNGLAALADLVAPDDSPVTRHFGEAGAVLVGRTNTPEFSMRLCTDNPLFGPTVNPWDPGVTCGGSSGGAGVATTAGFAAINHGNDIAGSVRVPALHCGVFGLRPTQGRIPAFLPTATAERPTLSWLMSTQGPLTRSVADIRLALSVMAQRDPRDPLWSPAPIEGPPHRSPRRVGIVTEIPGLPLAPSVRDALDTTARLLEDAGHEVVPVDVPDLVDTGRLASRLLFTDLAAQMVPTAERIGSERIRWYFHTLLEIEPPVTDVTAYVEQLARRTTLIREWSAILEDHAVVVMPLLAGGLLEVDVDLRDEASLRTMWADLAPSIAVNLLGLPSLMTPTGLHDGLPTGVQIVAGRHREDLCIGAAEVIEAATGRLVAPLG